jgi:hypothetical protein
LEFKKGEFKAPSKLKSFQKSNVLGFETWALNLNRILKSKIFLKMERNDFERL